jgi:RNA polymerase sigma factor for flagellar operon FliA
VQHERVDRMTTIDDSAALLWSTYALEPSRASRNALVVHYVPLVRVVAARTKSHTVAEFDDLVGVGMLALIRAIERYDPTLGVAFSTFARWPLRGAMLDTTRRRSRRERPGAQIVSLDAPIATTEDWYHDPADPGPGPADVLDGDDRWRELAELVNRLEPRLRFLVAMVDIEGRSQAETAAMLGLDPTWVCQLHSRAMRKLQTMAGTVGYAHHAAKAAARAWMRDGGVPHDHVVRDHRQRVIQRDLVDDARTPRARQLDG